MRGTRTAGEGTWEMGDNTSLKTAADEKSPTLERLDDQIGWYGRNSKTAQLRYKFLKIIQVIVAALIPLIAVFPVPEPISKWAVALLGLIVLIVEAVQQLNQYQENWISYRSTCEALKHEKYLFLAGAGPYAGTGKQLALLADRIEGLISQEHAKWVSAQQGTAARDNAEAEPSVKNNQPRTDPDLR
jgi:hypothetical protein